MTSIHLTAVLNDPYIIGKRAEIMEYVVLGAQPMAYETISKFPVRKKRRYAEHGTKLGNDVTIHAGSLIMAGLEKPTTLEDRVKLAQKVNVGHDSRIGKGTRVMVGVNILGYVDVGAGSYLGSGSVIKQRTTIGDNSVVGMGATVTKDIPDNCLAYNVTKEGDPIYCRVVRKSRSTMKGIIRKLLF